MQSGTELISFPVVWQFILEKWENSKVDKINETEV